MTSPKTPETTLSDLYRLKQQLDETTLGLKQHTAFMGEAVTKAEHTSEKLHDSSTKLLAHLDTFALAGEHIKRDIHLEVKAAAEEMGNKLAVSVMEFINDHVIDTLDAMNAEIEKATTGLRAVQTTIKRRTFKSLIKSLLLYGSVGLICSSLGGFAAVSAYMQWVLPDHRVYYEFGRLWKDAFDPLPDHNKKAILNLLKERS